ncbi:MAG: glycosyltransferase family 4 protein [Rhizomicrobium sp.]
MASEFEFFVISRDRDAGESAPFSNVLAGKWLDVDGARIRYLDPREQRLSMVRTLIRDTPHELIHLNSVVSLPFAAYPALVRRFNLASPAPVLVSPHGEMARGALSNKRLRKSLYLLGADAVRLFGDATWHAATVEEEADIRRVWGTRAKIEVAPVLPPQLPFFSAPTAHSPKVQGALRAVFFARVDRMKNLEFAIDLVSSVENVTLDICGPIGQPDYWAECQKRIATSARPQAFRYIGDMRPENVTAALSKYEVLLLPSQNESFGYAILEALAVGCPVLISDRTPWKALEAVGVGFDVPLDRPELFRARLEQLRNLDEPAHREIRSRGIGYARDYIANSPARDAMLAIYRRAMARAA